MLPLVIGGAAVLGYIVAKSKNGKQILTLVPSEGHPLAAILDQLDQKGFKFYDSSEENAALNLDLGTVRTSHLIDIAGDFLLVESLDGTATVRFNDKGNQAVSLNRLKTFTTPFRRLFITNTSQAGKTLRLAIGRDASFLAKALEAIKIAKIDGTEINPAEKEAFVPLEVASQHGVAETADTDILASDITPTNTPCLFRVMAMLETTGVFSAMLKSGAVTKQMKLNGGIALTADCAYLSDVLIHSGDTVNFQSSASGDITLRVQEIVAGVQ